MKAIVSINFLLNINVETNTAYANSAEVVRKSLLLLRGVKNKSTKNNNKI